MGMSKLIDKATAQVSATFNIYVANVEKITICNCIYP